MKTRPTLWKRKLVKTMFFSTAVLIAALMIGSAASAGIARNVTMTEKTPASIASFTKGDTGARNLDVGIDSIVTPASGIGAPITPVVKVKNYGTDNAVNVPVNLIIGKRLVTGTPQDFESTNGGYTATDVPANIWQWGTPTSGPMAAHSGVKLWATVLAGNYPDSGNGKLETPVFTVPPYCEFTFWHWYSLENYFDGGNVKISTDGGSTWTIIDPVGGYPESAAASDNAGIPGEPCYSGTTSPAWNKAVFDLSTYAGQSAKIRFHFGSDPSVNYAGWYIDDVTVSSISWVNEYNHTMNVNVNAGQTVNVTFPVWTPSDLFVNQNFDVTYNAEARTQLAGDSNPANNYLNKIFNLHFGFFHDVAITNLVAPGDGYATVITPEAIVTNLGQYSESNVATHMVIDKKNVVGTTEDFEATNGGYTTIDVPANIWQWGTPTSGPGSAHSGVNVWATVLGGQYPISANAKLTTPSFAVQPNTELSFWQWYYMENNYDGGNVKISINNGVTWTVITPLGGYPQASTYSGNAGIPNEPAYSGQSGGWLKAVFDLSSYAGQNAMLRFHMGSDSSVNYDGWYIDDVTIGVNNWINEYDHTITQTIPAGGVADLLFPNWTPSDITRSTIDYRVVCTATITVDGNLTNNQVNRAFTLTYIHDTGVTQITEPTGPGKGQGDVIFHQRPYTPTESWSFHTTTALSSPAYLCQEDFSGLSEPIGGIQWWGIAAYNNGGWVEGSPAGMKFEIKFYEDNAGAPGDVVATFSDVVLDAQPYAVYSTFQAYYWDYQLPSNVALEAGWVSIQNTFSGDGVSWLLWSGGPEGTFNALQNGAGMSPSDNLAFNLTAGGGGGGGNWPPGTYNVAGIAKDLGSFTEHNIQVNTKIWKQVGKADVLFYQENVTVTTLTPGQTADVTFPDVTFANADEGNFRLEMRTMLAGDDRPSNDKKTLSFVIQAPDITPPVTNATLAGTLGQQSWYVSNVTVTLSATDPAGGRTMNGGKWPTGVNHTYYKIDNGAWTEYTTPFMVTTDGQHVVSYYSDDKAGNNEAPKSISFKMDRTAPTITLSGTPQNLLKTKWLFVANVTDVTSGIAKVEFYVDDALIGTVTTAPYEFLYHGTGQDAQAIVYDNAGNSKMSAKFHAYTPNDMNSEINSMPVQQTLQQR